MRKSRMLAPLVCVLLGACGTTVDVPLSDPAPSVSASPEPSPSPSEGEISCSVDGFVIYEGSYDGPITLDIDGCYNFSLFGLPVKVCADCIIN